jgi:hypothetical protein
MVSIQPDEFFEQSYVARLAGTPHYISTPSLWSIGEGFSLQSANQNIMETNFSHLKASKVCTCCKIEKPLSEFGKNRSTKDGHSCYCRDCQNAKMRASRGRKKDALPSVTSPAPDAETHAPIEHAEDKLLKDCTPRELILELKNRGYKGRLVWQPPMPQPIVINIEEFN